MRTGRTIGELAREVRSKNAGPFWQTLDVFFARAEDYEQTLATEAITKASIAQLYQVPPEHVQVFALSRLNVIKVSFPRAVAAGSFADRDQHAGQQHVPLARLELPPPASMVRTPDE